MISYWLIREHKQSKYLVISYRLIREHKQGISYSYIQPSEPLTLQQNSFNVYLHHFLSKQTYPELFFLAQIQMRIHSSVGEIREKLEEARNQLSRQLLSLNTPFRGINDPLVILDILQNPATPQSAKIQSPQKPKAKSQQDWELQTWDLSLASLSRSPYSYSFSMSLASSDASAIPSLTEERRKVWRNRGGKSMKIWGFLVGFYGVMKLEKTGAGGFRAGRGEAYELCMVIGGGLRRQIGGGEGDSGG